MAAEPVIRRVVAARAANPADIDDLVQDCLERLLAAHGRLAPEAVLPYAIVIARNLVSSHATSTRPRPVPRHARLTRENPNARRTWCSPGRAAGAMTAALARLSPQERRDVLAYYGDHSSSGATARSASAPSASAPGAGAGEGRGALRVRMARTRAKLRLEYLLAFRHIELPTPLCHRVLLAISSGDTRRQRELDAGQHLLDCEVCDTLSEPLDRRSIALTAIAIPAGLAAWAAGKARAHPVHHRYRRSRGRGCGGRRSSPEPRARTMLFPAPRPLRRPVRRGRVSARTVPAAVSHLSVAGQAVPRRATRGSR